MIWNAFVKVFVDHDNANNRSGRKSGTFLGVQGNVKRLAQGSSGPAAE